VPTLFRKILVPHDFSAHATNALRVAAGLAREHRGRLTVLHVLAPYPVAAVGLADGVILPPTHDLVTEVKQKLEAAVGRVLTGRGAPKATCRVEVGDPAQRIVEAGRAADSVVMSTEGRTGLSHLLIGSVAEKVVRHSPRPVLTLRATLRSARAGAMRGRRRPGGRRRRKA
jgi:nucleotide-binding universal stress UspA family protein